MNKKNTDPNYKIIDVRTKTGNFLPEIIEEAKKTAIGNGFCIVQSFEPLPLYGVLAEMGFDHKTEKKSDTEFHVYFSKTTAKSAIQETPFHTDFSSITPIDKIADILTKYPFLKEKLIARNRKFEKLNNPIVFNTVGKFAKIQDVAKVSGENLEELIAFINDEIKKHGKK